MVSLGLLNCSDVTLYLRKIIAEQNQCKPQTKPNQAKLKKLIARYLAMERSVFEKKMK